MYSERDSLRRPWAHVGRSARSARIGSVVMGGAVDTGVNRVGKGLTPLHTPGTWVMAGAARPRSPRDGHDVGRP